MIKDMIKWVIDYKRFTPEERALLNTPREEKIIQSNEFLDLVQEYFSRMPYCNISNKDRYITFNDSGTSFIKDIFDYEVDDNTLVISTLYEHGSVKDQLSHCKNVLYLDFEKDIRAQNITKILEEAKKYKKVFVYIIGTQICTGEITPQNFFESLKEALVKENINHKILIDDVHGMFVVPRDYSFFDYILYTAHSMVRNYEMGLLISREKRFGIEAYNWGKDYLPRLDLILNRKDKMLYFNLAFYQYFSEVLSNKYFSTYVNTVDHIFAIKTQDLYFTENMFSNLDKYDIRLSEHNMFENFIEIRFQEFITHTYEEIEEGLNLLDKYIKQSIIMSTMRD